MSKQPLVSPTALEAARSFAAGQHRLFVGGAWTDAREGKTFASQLPATGEKLADISRAPDAHVDRAVAAAPGAMDSTEWADMKPNARALLLYRLADAIERNIEELAALETLDNGM